MSPRTGRFLAAALAFEGPDIPEAPCLPRFAHAVHRLRHRCRIQLSPRSSGTWLPLRSERPLIRQCRVENTFGYVSGNPRWSADPFGLDETFWGGPGRSRFDGPANGNWGGQNWSGGRAPRSNGGQPGNKPPMDSADRCYMGHDNCYAACRARYGARAGQLCLPIVCHRQLKKCLNELGNDCSKWPSLRGAVRRVTLWTIGETR